MRTFAHPHAARARRGQVLILIAGSLLLSGGSGLVAGALLAGRSLGKVSMSVSAVVADPGRRGRAKQVLKDWEQDTERDLEHFRDAAEGLGKLLSSRETTRARLDAELVQLDRDMDAGVRRALARREELRGLLTDAEWRAVFAP
jgi:hypothetical protein